MKKGQVAIFLTIIVASIVMVGIFAVLMPLGINFTSIMFEEGENILIRENSTLQSINDPTVKAAVFGAVGESSSITTQQVDILASFYQYAWIIILVILGIIGVLLTRNSVEFGGGII